jgi:hypothetical protein
VVAAVALVLEVLAALAQRVLDPVPGDGKPSPNRHRGMSVDVLMVAEETDAVGH